jgi:L-ascorbate metabolism protein UlaG (beta-lactamase superfamily)
MYIQLIRNAALRLNYKGKTILIDPCLGPKHSYDSLAGREPNPIVPLPMSVEEAIAGVDLVLVSHLHRDHFDATANDALPRTLPLICHPEQVEQIRAKGFTDVHPLDKPIKWQGITFTPTLAQHAMAEPWISRLAPVMGFTLTAEREPGLYWCGDTVWYPPVEAVIELFHPDVIITHSGGATLEDSDPIIMDVEQTLIVCKDAPGATVIAVHMEALDHCPVTRTGLRAAAEAARVGNRLIIPEDGEIVSRERW